MTHTRFIVKNDVLKRWSNIESHAIKKVKVKKKFIRHKITLIYKPNPPNTKILYENTPCPSKAEASLDDELNETIMHTI